MRQKSAKIKRWIWRALGMPRDKSPGINVPLAHTQKITENYGLRLLVHYFLCF
jgi:hypothetical protein